LNFHGLCQFGKLWEIVRMPKKGVKSPGVGDPVFGKRHGKAAFIVMRVDTKNKTVDLASTAKIGSVLDGRVPWSELTVLDESQNALRVVREDTEEN
jgi:hypothetical protein